MNIITNMQALKIISSYGCYAFTGYKFIRYLISKRQAQPIVQTAVDEYKTINNNFFVIVDQSSSDGLLTCMLGNSNKEDMINMETFNRFQKFMEFIKPEDNIDIILDTNGGCAAACHQMAMILGKHKGKIRIYIPRKAYSAGTVLALCATELYMNDNAFLSPCDSICSYGFSIESFLRLINEKKDVNDLFALLAGDFKKVHTSDVEFFDNHMCKKYDEEKRNKIKEKFFSGTLYHGTPISVDDLRELGIEIKGVCDPIISRIVDEQKVPKESKSLVQINW